MVDPVMAIPEEDIRSVIFNLIPQNETLNLRLVCKNWNQEVQNSYEYDIAEFNENSPNFKPISQLRIKNLEIEKLKTTPVFNSDGTSIFKHPNAIRKLVMENSIITPSNFHDLISLFSKNLQLLEVQVTPRHHNYLYPDVFLDFKNLKHLSLYGASGRKQCEDNPKNLFQLLENSSFSNLKILKVELVDLRMTLEVKARAYGNLLRLISKHGKYLEELFIDDFHVDVIEFPEPLQEQELFRMLKIQTLKKLSLDWIPVSSRMREFWNEFSCNQKELEQLEIQIESVSIIHQITLKNSATLTQLNMQGHRWSPYDPPFDLSIFKNCQALKVFRLHPIRTDIPKANPEDPDVVNFHCLPENIVELLLDDLEVLSEELLTAFQTNNDTSGTKGFKKLTTLDLTKCGNRGLFGINAVVLREIMLTPRPTLTYVFLRGIHKRAADNTGLLPIQMIDDICIWLL